MKQKNTRIGNLNKTDFSLIHRKGKSMNLDEIKSTKKPVCLHCKDPITLDNWSGWEGFQLDGKTTQAICKFCLEIENTIYEKAND
jgi:hypothetical protein